MQASDHRGRGEEGKRAECDVYRDQCQGWLQCQTGEISLNTSFCSLLSCDVLDTVALVGDRFVVVCVCLFICFVFCFSLPDSVFVSDNVFSLSQSVELDVFCVLWYLDIVCSTVSILLCLIDL